jgi:iron complex transport system ATP-binding protein
VSFRVENLSFAYGTRTVLEGLNFALEAGRFYGLVGPNGCGKSTLLDLLAGHRRPAHGRILYRQQPIESHGRRRLSRELALVPQDFYINFPFRVEEVVMMGRYPHLGRFARAGAADWQRVDAAMARTGIAAFRGRLVSELSGGERQRVVIARALAQDAAWLFLDEATSNLDVNHALAVLGQVRRSVRQEGKTAVAVLQDLNLAALFCDELLLLKQGRLVTAGPTAEVLTAANIRRLFEVDARVARDPESGSRHVVFRVAP